jgi:hypothetical protein
MLALAGVIIINSTDCFVVPLALDVSNKRSSTEIQTSLFKLYRGWEFPSFEVAEIQRISDGEWFSISPPERKNLNSKKNTNVRKKNANPN